MSEDRLIEEHRDLVRRLARKVRAELDLTCELEDLEAYGLEGLVQARSRFDADRGVKFSTFAYYRVRGAIMDGVRQMAYLPRRAHRRLRSAEATDRLAEPLGEQRGRAPAGGPTLDSTVAALDSALSQLTASFVLSALGQEEPAADQPGEHPEEAFSSAQEASRLRGAVRDLPERERALVQGFYFDGRRFDEVAAELGISKSWASRLHAKALARLRENLGGD